MGFQCGLKHGWRVCPAKFTKLMSSHLFFYKKCIYFHSLSCWRTGTCFVDPLLRAGILGVHGRRSQLDQNSDSFNKK